MTSHRLLKYSDVSQILRVRVLVLDQHETEDTDEGSAAQQQQQQQQPTAATSQASSGDGPRQPRNVQIMHFPPVQIMMSQGLPGQPGSIGGGAAANPQMPQFGGPMLFGLPL